MKGYKFEKGIGFLYILFATLLFNIVIFTISYFNTSYLLIFLLQSILIIFNIHQIYYLILSKTLNLQIGENVIIINMLFGLRKIIIPFKDIIDIQKTNLNNKGIRLSGFSSKGFAYGRLYYETVGTIRMFVTNSKKTIIIKTLKENIAISPIADEEVLGLINKKLKKKNIIEKKADNISLYKDVYFIIPFMLTTLLILIYMIRPSMMYISGELNNLKLPIAFNPDFIPVKYGTAKDFIFNQLLYGALNMIIMICMYFAESLYSKYDRKSSYKYMYIALFVITVFFILQVRIINSYT